MMKDFVRISMRGLLCSLLCLVLCACASPPPNNALNDLAWSRMDSLKEEAKLLAGDIENLTADVVVEKSKQMVLSKLKDPESARFRNQKIIEFRGGKLLCGEVNAKNSYGGYVGFLPYMASRGYVILMGNDAARGGVDAVNMSLFNISCGQNGY